MVCGVMFQFLTRIELIFVAGVIWGSNFFLLYEAIYFSQYYLFKRLSIPLWVSLESLLNISWLYMWRFISGLWILFYGSKFLFYTSALLFWFPKNYSLACNQTVWYLYFCSFSGLVRLFVFCGAVKILAVFVLFLWKMPLER